MPVDQYIGGIEHAILHLLYSRFYTMFLRDIGLIHVGEPYRRLLTQGMVCKSTYRCPQHGFLFIDEMNADSEGLFCLKCSSPVEIGRVEKMSKSKKNVVDPDDIVDKYGADTVRLFCLSDSPPEKDLEWNEQGVEGCFRFLNRIWQIVLNLREVLEGTEPFRGSKDELDNEQKLLYQRVHRTIKKVTEDIERRYHFNTAISAIRELVNEIQGFQSSIKGPQARPLIRTVIETLLVLFNPFVPHITEELWEILGHKSRLFDSPWPSYDEHALEEEEMLIVVQVNGKVRSRLMVPSSFSEDDIMASVRNDQRIVKWLKGKKIQKAIYVPQKLINIVA